ncbi:MAG: formate dehydrogenase accessory protein FdhE, partial [Candidatus Zixiibacteriota bacterium]
RYTYLARPVRAAVRRALDETANAADWTLGYCPSCGLWPRMAWMDSESQRRILWCLGCNMTWGFRRFQCPFCMDADPRHHRFIEVDSNPSFRLDVCDICRRYLKTVTSTPCDAEMAYFETEHLDAAASDAGYIRDFIGFVAFDGKPSRALTEYIEKSST